MTLTTEELAGTTEGATEEKSRANKAAAVAAGGGSGGAPAGNWRSVGDIASELLERLRGSAGMTASVAASEAGGGSVPTFHRPDTRACRAEHAAPG